MFSGGGELAPLNVTKLTGRTGMDEKSPLKTHLSIPSQPWLCFYFCKTAGNIRRQPVQDKLSRVTYSTFNMFCQTNYMSASFTSSSASPSGFTFVEIRSCLPKILLVRTFHSDKSQALLTNSFLSHYKHESGSSGPTPWKPFSVVLQCFHHLELSLYWQ